MSLLADIQTELLQNGSSIGQTLLKIKFLANRLSSENLEEWVRYESGGYDNDIKIPDYRVVGITYTGTLVGYTNALHDVPIPNLLIEQHASEHWTTYKIRESMSVIDDTILRSDKWTKYSINTGNLSLLLQDKIYKNHNLTHLNGSFGVSAFVKVQSTVRSKLLDLTMMLEKEVPKAADIAIGVKPPIFTNSDTEKVTQVTNQIFYGNVTNISHSSGNATINVANAEGDIGSFVGTLISRGVPESDAKELAAIVQAEKPQGQDAPLGEKSEGWLSDKLGKAASGIWGMAKPIAADLIKDAIRQYYGL
jgi:hypothetical protein